MLKLDGGCVKDMDRNLRAFFSMPNAHILDACKQFVGNEITRDDGKQRLQTLINLVNAKAAHEVQILSEAQLATVQAQLDEIMAWICPDDVPSETADDDDDDDDCEDPDYVHSGTDSSSEEYDSDGDGSDGSGGSDGGDVMEVD